MATLSILMWHVVGLVCLFVYWIGCLRWLGFKPNKWMQWNAALEGWWGDRIIWLAEFWFNAHFDVEGAELLAPGPVVVFSRYSSVIDTMMPLRFIEHYNGMIARIVKKRALLWDPCIDSVSRRMPRTFVRRGSGDPEREREMIRALTAGMTEREGLWMFPEGTRFTPSKRQHILTKLRQQHPQAAKRAAQLRYTLPPRPAGAIAVLDCCAEMDVVFCAHTGLEGANRLENFINGSLYKRTIKVKFWRIAAADIPTDTVGRIEWIHRQWLKVDKWVEENQDPDLTALLARE